MEPSDIAKNLHGDNRFVVTSGPHNMPSLEVEYPTPDERKKIYSLINCRFINDIRYKLTTDAGAFLQSDSPDYILIEFWQPNYQGFVDWLNGAQPTQMSTVEKPIAEFQGPYRFLSNFWPAEVILDNQIYPSVEAAYQAAKTFDQGMREQIRHMTKPGDAKRIGRKLKMRPDWESVKLGIMEDLVRQKFTNHSDLKSKLLATGNAELIESNTWHDTFWGVCNGVGKNHLGKILMKVREELRG